MTPDSKFDSKFVPPQLRPAAALQRRSGLTSQILHFGCENDIF